MGAYKQAIHDLAYCLYTLTDTKRQDPKEAGIYNALIADWATLSALAESHPPALPTQTEINF